MAKSNFFRLWPKKFIWFHMYTWPCVIVWLLMATFPLLWTGKCVGTSFWIDVQAPLLAVQLSNSAVIWKGWARGAGIRRISMPENQNLSESALWLFNDKDNHLRLLYGWKWKANFSKGWHFSCGEELTAPMTSEISYNITGWFPWDLSLQPSHAKTSCLQISFPTLKEHDLNMNHPRHQDLG